MPGSEKTRTVDEANIQFFSDNDRYAQSVSELTTYRNIRAALTGALSGSRRLLDIGNGGVFDYDLGVADEIVGLDLFLDEVTNAVLPLHVRLMHGDARALPADVGTFDAVAMIMLIHHLVGPRADDILGTTEEMLDAAARILDPGGKLVIVESVVGRIFHRFEQAIWPAAYRTLTRKSGGHPPAFQLTSDILMDLVTRRFTVERFEPISVGPLLLQFGRRFPSALSPARPVLIIARPR